MSNPLQDPSAQIKKEVDGNFDFLYKPAKNYTTGGSAAITKVEQTPPASTRTVQGGIIRFAATESLPKSPEERGLAAAREVIQSYSTGPAINIGDALNFASEPDVLGMGKEDIAKQAIKNR